MDLHVVTVYLCEVGYLWHNKGFQRFLMNCNKVAYGKAFHMEFSTPKVLLVTGLLEKWSVKELPPKTVMVTQIEIRVLWLFEANGDAFSLQHHFVVEYGYRFYGELYHLQGIGIDKLHLKIPDHCEFLWFL